MAAAKPAATRGPNLRRESRVRGADEGPAASDRWAEASEGAGFAMPTWSSRSVLIGPFLQVCHDAPQSRASGLKSGAESRITIIGKNSNSPNFKPKIELNLASPINFTSHKINQLKDIRRSTTRLGNNIIRISG